MHRGMHGGADAAHGSEELPRRPLRHGTLRRVVGLHRPYRGRLAGLTVAVVVQSALGIVPALLIARIIDGAIPDGDRTLLVALVSAMAGVTVVSGALNYFQAWLSTRIGLRVMQDLRAALYAHLQRQPIAFFTSTRTGDIQSRISNDVMNTQSVLTDTLSSVMGSLAIVVVSFVAMVFISWQLSLVAVALVPVFAFFTVRVGSRRRKLTTETQRALSDLTSRTGETLSVSGVLLAKTFGREREQVERFEQDNTRLTDLSVRQRMSGQAFFIVVQTFFGIAPAIAWGIAGWMITGGLSDVSVGEVVALTTIQVRMLFPLAGLLNRGVEITSSLALFDRIFEYLDLKPAIQDPAEPVSIDRAAVTGEVRFDRVSFAYAPPAGEAVAMPRSTAPAMGAARTDGEFELIDVDFVARPGTLTALVGPSGSGKTTVGYLLARLYDVQAGAVTIDGQDVRKLALSDLNGVIGVVTQDTFLFHASVRENLLYGKPSASEAEMIEAARAAQIHDMVAALPDGYGTLVGERGHRLSGGERQRVAIARVLLADPRILLLDEATSSLDTLSERQIQQALRKLMAGRTAVAIAHRLSTVVAADQIIVMDRGRIVEKGRHEELLARSGLYRRLYEEQFVVG